MQDPVIGKVIGNYRVLAPLGEGGMAKVYRAEHATIQREAALKLLKPEYSSREHSVARFFHEAQAVNRIRHEGLVDIFDFGKTPEGDHFILMELLHGESLTDTLAPKKPLAFERILHIGIQIAHALEATHQKGIVHRDLKDANVFLTTRAGQKDFVKILDFGIAKLLDGTSPDVIKTKDGAMIGTPLYISPEQARGTVVGPPTDIYAFGCLLFVMATGEPPFFDDNAIAVALKHIDEPPPKPSSKNPKIPERLEAIILRCLEKSPEARYPSMLAVARELEALLPSGTAVALEVTEKLPRRKAAAPPRRLLVGGAAAVVVAAVGYLLFGGPATPPRGEVQSAASLVSSFEAPIPAASPVSQASTAPVVEASAPPQKIADKNKVKPPPDKKKDPAKSEPPEAKTEPPKVETPPESKAKPTEDPPKANGWTVDPFKK
jgi:eukaryotic-like serine/threonine-protein kinase